MATRAQIVQELLTEFDKNTPAAATKIDLKVGDITLELLNLNGGRFKDLERSTTLTLVSGTTEYLLPDDFNTAKKTHSEVDSEGKFIAECTVVSKAAVHRRIAEGQYRGYRIGYIAELATADIPGKYLILGADPEETTYWEFDYYRTPTKEDTDIIRNIDILKDGVRAGLPEFVGPQMAVIYQGKYEREKQGFREDPEKNLTQIQTQPARRVGRHNQKMQRIGQGG